MLIGFTNFYMSKNVPMVGCFDKNAFVCHKRFPININALDAKLYDRAKSFFFVLKTNTINKVRFRKQIMLYKVHVPLIVGQFCDLLVKFTFMLYLRQVLLKVKYKS